MLCQAARFVKLPARAGVNKPRCGFPPPDILVHRQGLTHIDLI